MVPQREVLGSASLVVNGVPGIGSRSYGWRVEKRPDALIASTNQTSQFGTYAGWQHGGEVRLDPAYGRIHVTLAIDGGARYLINGDEVELNAGEFIVLDGDSEVLMSGPTPISSFSWWFSTPLLQSRIYRSMFAKPIIADPFAGRAIVAATRALLHSERFADNASTNAFGRGLEQMVGGLLLDRPMAIGIPPAPVAANALLSDAQNVIEARFRDPGFNVNRLAQELHVSRATLHRPFQVIGTTPGLEIAARRISEAATMLSSPTTDRVTVRAVAELSGFSSVRSLRLAFRRAGRTLPEPATDIFGGSPVS